MLAGAAVSQNCVNLGTDHFSLLPGDLDGSVAPSVGTAAYLVEQDPYSWTALRSFRLTTGFGGSPFALSGATVTPVPTMYASCYAACVPQPGTAQRLDTLGGRLMYRLPYRVVGGVGTLLATASRSTSGTTGWAPVWYRLTDSGGGVVLADSGSVAPDAYPRSMGSAALDHDGNMLVGYSISSTSGIFPGLRVSGRTADDPAGQTGPEQVLMAGGGSQTGPYSRWGDYTDMTVDPADDCTFWYVGQYQAATGSSFTWNTRIGSYRFPSCGRDRDLGGRRPLDDRPAAGHRPFPDGQRDVRRRQHAGRHVDGDLVVRGPLRRDRQHHRRRARRRSGQHDDHRHRRQLLGERRRDGDRPGAHLPHGVAAGSQRPRGGHPSSTQRPAPTATGRRPTSAAVPRGRRTTPPSPRSTRPGC